MRLGNYIKYDIGKTPPRKQEEFWVDAKYPWITIADMIADEKIYSTKDEINSLALKTHFKDKLVPIGTLIMSFKLTVGRVSILGIEAVHNEAIISIYPFIDDDKIATNFLFKFLPLLSEQGKTKKAIKGNTLNSDSLNNILLPLPPLSEQKRIVDKLEEILPLVEKYKEDKERLDELNLSFAPKLKKSILDYAIKGKLVEQNLEDESVEILLQKIRQEKQRLVKDKKLKADKFPQSTIFVGEDNSPYEKIGKETHCIADEIPFEIPSSWAWVRLGEISYIVGSKNNQVKAIEIKKYGDFPVVSQSQNLIDGYSSESQKLIKDIPLVMFGDHTRNVKYIDFNFIIGADGTKFHKCIIVEPKFLFYWMKFASEKLKNRGYARHYTLLKSQFIPLPPLPEQKRIVAKIEELLKFVDILQSSLK